MFFPSSHVGCSTRPPLTFCSSACPSSDNLVERCDRRTGFVQRLLRLVGLDWAALDFSTLCGGQRTLNVTLSYHGSKGPLHLLIDSTGIKSESEGEWNARMHGSQKRRIWRKMHIRIDEETLEVRASPLVRSAIGHRTGCASWTTRGPR